MTTGPGRQITGDGGVIADQADAAAVTAEQQAQQYNAAEQIVIRHRTWFQRLLPKPEQGGIGAEPFAIALLSQLKRTAHKSNGLMAAALNDPDSLIFAATDCAARNLWPGEEYWFVPFNDKTRGTGLHVVGMPGWKGELQQVYRSGMVEAVVAELVYEGDHFRWRPTAMRVPEHEPADVSHDPQFLRRVYVFAHLLAGGVTHPVVLGRTEIERAKEASRAPKADFWENPKWTGQMWLKTGIHFAYDRMPHSNAFNTQLLQAYQVAQERFPALMLNAEGGEAALPPGLSVPAAIPGQAAARPVPPAPGNGAGGGNGGNGGGRDRVTLAGRAEAVPDPGPPITPQTTGQLNYKFKQAADWTGDEYRDRRIAVAGVLGNLAGAPLPITAIAQLTDAQGRAAIEWFDTELLPKTGGDKARAAAALQGIYDHRHEAGGQRQAAGPGGDQPPPPDDPGDR
jgi:recombinational DNA repair protein RecT